jgi:hypothetical protein
MIDSQKMKGASIMPRSKEITFRVSEEVFNDLEQWRIKIGADHHAAVLANALGFYKWGYEAHQRKEPIGRNVKDEKWIIIDFEDLMTKNWSF